MVKRRINPNKILIDRSKLDRNQLIAEASTGNMYYAWLIVMPSLLSRGEKTKEEIVELWQAVNEYIDAPDMTGERLNRELQSIQAFLDCPTPYPNLSMEKVHTRADLSSIQKKLRKNALHAAICIIAIGMNATGKYSLEELQSIFFDTDLTLAEIENGCTTYEDLTAELARHDISISEDLTCMEIKD